MSRLKRPIIPLLLAALLALLAGCSSVRLLYSNAPQLAWWWLDGYVDFSREQAPLARQAVDRYYDWHRTSQLAEYLPLLAAAQRQVVEPTTAAAACQWQDQIRARLEPSLQQGLAHAADLLPGLGEAQFAAIARRDAKKNAELRDDFVQPDPAERADASVRRVLDRVEMLYGSLDEPQRRVVRDGVLASPFDAELWLAERQRRQRDLLQTLRRLHAERADRGARLAALRALALRTEASPDPRYRAYQLKLTATQCAFAAQIHNATTPAQRLRARQTLSGWEADLRTLMAARQEPG